MRILITGINGFVGSHLAEYCLKQGDEVFGTVRNRSDLKNIEGIKDKLNLYECELTDEKNIGDIISAFEPDKIFHLAAQSYVPTSWESPWHTLQNNIKSTLNIFESVKKYVKDCKVLVAGSSEEYGEPIEIPMKETHPLNPLSPYGVSKVACDKLACQYVKSYGMKIVLTRAFNHTGPRRHDNFVCASFAKQVAEAQEGHEIRVGNLEAVRDFTDVRDMVRAYYMAMDCEGIKFGEPYNICSGKGEKIRGILQKLIIMSGKQITTVEDKDRMRPSDIHELVGDCSKFNEVTGWKPQIKFDQTLKDIYEYYANQKTN